MKNEALLEIRTTEETKKAFKDKALELGQPQGQALETMLLAIDMQDEIGRLPEHKSEIEVFQKYCNSISSLYLSAINNVENQRTLAEESVKGKLESKDQQIIELQKKINDQEIIISETSVLKKELESTKVELEAIKEQKNTLEKINASLQLQIVDQEEVANLKIRLNEVEKELAVKDTELKVKDEMIDVLKSKTI